MTRRWRQFDAATVRAIRADYRARRAAEAAIAEAKRVLEVTPDAMNWARSLGVAQQTVLMAAKGQTYKAVQ